MTNYWALESIPVLAGLEPKQRRRAIQLAVAQLPMSHRVGVTAAFGALGAAVAVTLTLGVRPLGNAAFPLVAAFGAAGVVLGQQWLLARAMPHLPAAAARVRAESVRGV